MELIDFTVDLKREEAVLEDKFQDLGDQEMDLERLKVSIDKFEQEAVKLRKKYVIFIYKL